MCPFPTVRKFANLKRMVKETIERNRQLTNSRSIRLLMASGPAALPTGRDLKTVSISTGVRCNELSSDSTL